ncbi:Malate dehydrogenase (oxaloacetate-decarboxylating) (NADP(+)) [Gluconacetobacter diazotrophicus PA1 5]|uniref:NADP-dependent malic enzyme n=2 Tax=Gluconacetobacter diazotrophicus TaxID=33996 RepID=A9HH05_GLUDA|nr:NAD-dependent malic enzyme [Gluconacetobacter diazotrophicus]ACI51593.1 Malate dehydrogenase (oxaloacetate-decarboxylating) (NADP(+)) [Gluconacetobacter diazotrophicus PA1 5]MBB2157598.1 NAD-dependent malic enzyme [Gluconacetobacter diazotrophicus]TWB03418.1 malate dehydrogenase (oxaloacetate-decarboxylating)(NADP+) [Gluconacetobacter diazotrophicus]CAP55571.1 NADP-dependent malic enzyme [Gluconacetobacter diazotrophicus PA1 5]
MNRPARHTLRGTALLNDPAFNRGTAFTAAERQTYGLEGLLPPQIETLERQAERALRHLDAKPTDLERYIYLAALVDRNETLFYKVLMSDPARFVPIVYAPTLGEACKAFSHIYRRPRGMYISLEMKGRIADILRNWPVSDVRFICVTTGGRILGLGDIGANGMGIPIGKLQLYTACGAVPPQVTLPIQLDIGTTNAALRADPLYLGLRHEPPPQAELDAFVEEFVTAVQEVFPACCIHFEDWKGTDAIRYLERYRERVLCYNDDIQGTASVTLAGLVTALRIKGEKLSDQTVLFLGAGSSALGTSDLLVKAMQAEGLSQADARARITMMDVKGLVEPSRTDLSEEQRRYAHAAEPTRDLMATIRRVRPSVLIGVSTVGGAFTQPVVELMAAINARPIIFPLSIPHSECSAEQAYAWSDGRALYAAGVQFPQVMRDDHVFRPGQANNFYIFPGLGLAVYATRPRLIPDALIIEAAHALADQVDVTAQARGMLYPPQNQILEVQVTSACRLAEYLFDAGLATVPRPDDIRSWIEGMTYSPTYAPDA